MNRSVVVTFATGALLSLSGCGKSPPTTPPPEPELPTNPPKTDTDPLPMWDDVKSRHPEGATNPPAPELIVTPDGDCYKKWVGRMGGGDGNSGDRVEACESDCGTQIQCPPKAAELLEAHRSGKVLQPK